MPRKTITIFITTFIIVGIIILVVYYWLNKTSDKTTVDETPWYQNFNPFGSGSNTNTPTTGTGTDTEPVDTETPEENISRFYQITDFAIAGATFLEDTRLVVKSEATSSPKETKEIIDEKTKEGRKEIQNILNKELPVNPNLVVDGNFGKKTTQAIKDFQVLKNITVTGIIDEATAPYFTRIVNSTEEASPTEQASSVRFVERMNGHIYKMFLDTKEREKISNSTIPSIYESFFNNKADTVIYRYLSDKTISSFIATLGAPKGEFLPQNISDLSISRDGTKFFYLFKNTTGSTGVVGVFENQQKNVVFNSPFSEWLSQWDNNGRIFLTTKPSYGVPGSMFFLNTTNKTISKLFGNINGLTTLINNKGSSVLYSTSTETGPKLSVMNLSEHSSVDLNSYGLAEKCVWSNDNINIYCAVPNTIKGNQYPDVWYQGLVSFDDYFVKINTQTGDRVTIANEANENPMDATYLFLSKDENTLFFTNKKDSTLWSLDIR